MTAEEIVHQLNDDGIMTEKKAVRLIESYANEKTLTTIEQAVGEELNVPYIHVPEGIYQKAVCNRIIRSVRRKLK